MEDRRRTPEASSRKRRCWGRHGAFYFKRCERRVGAKYFCADHRPQPVIVVLAVVSGLYGFYANWASIQSWLQIPPVFAGVLTPEVLVGGDFQTPQIEIGNSGAIFRYTGSPEGGTLFKFFDPSQLKIERLRGKILVSTQVRDRTGRLITELIRNEWRVRPSLLWDRNYNAQSLEVRDESGDIVFQATALSDRIRLQGIWRGPDGRFVELAEKTDFQHVNRGFLQFGFPGQTQEAPIRPMFRYPSDLHLGELL